MQSKKPAKTQAKPKTDSVGPSGIVWTNEKRKLSDLKDWPKNPRRLSESQAAQIAKSIVKFGFADPVIINTDNTIVGGHQRKRVLIAVKIAKPDMEVDVRVPSRLLDQEEVAELNIRLNKNQGEFDFDVLANEFEEAKLIEWGFEAPEFGMEDESKPHKGDAAQDHSFCPKCKRPY